MIRIRRLELHPFPPYFSEYFSIPIKSILFSSFNSLIFKCSNFEHVSGSLLLARLKPVKPRRKSGPTLVQSMDHFVFRLTPNEILYECFDLKNLNGPIQFSIFDVKTRNLRSANKMLKSQLGSKIEYQGGILSGTSRLRYPSLPGIPDKMVSLLTYGLIRDQEGILSTLICLDLTVTQ